VSDHGDRQLGLYVLDDEGEAQRVPDLFTWAAWDAETARDRVLVQTRIGRRQAGPPVVVSTVFLGVDYRHWGDGPPVLWETMIFGGPFEGYQQRYTAPLDALRGHAFAVALVEAFAAAPRKTKKALRKFGDHYGMLLGLPRGDARRVRRVVARVRAHDDR
jgi:hypothetical protein